MKLKRDTSHIIDFQLDPEIREFADTVLKDYIRLDTGKENTVVRSRQNAEKVRRPWAAGGPEMAEVEHICIPGDKNSITLRVYKPEPGNDPRPALVYLHGGGWTLFSLDTHDRLMREYAHRAGISVVGVKYSLAPEHKFPHQVLEVCDAIGWLFKNGADVGVDGNRLAIGGDSAGGNLALATFLKLRELNQSHWIKAMLLNYGAFDADVDTESHERFDGDRFLLTTEEKVEFWSHYLAKEDAHSPMANPLRADLHSAPPTFMVIASHDILVDENIAMAQRLADAGAVVKAVVYPGTTHSFLEAVSIARVSDRALNESSDWLRKSLFP